MVADLEEVVVFALYDTVKFPLLLPLAGETVHHALALEVAVQAIFEVTPTVLLPAPDGAEPEDALRANSGVFPLWVSI